MESNKKRAQELYEKIKYKVHANKGKIVALELDSGEYFIGESLEEAYDKAHEKFPSKKFYFKRIGFKAAFFVGAISS